MDVNFDATTMAVILGLVEFAKQLGVVGKASLGLSLVLGLVLGIAQQVSANGTPVDFAGWFGVAIVGLAYGLAASGLFDLAKRFSNKYA